jgi:ATP-dependent DNA helicase PIF1
MLNEMRYGRMQESTIQIFRTLSRQVVYTDSILPTEMCGHCLSRPIDHFSKFTIRYPTRNEVNSANSSQLRQLPGEGRTYEAQDLPGVDHKGQTISRVVMSSELDRLVAPRFLELKVGAQVMLIKVCYIVDILSNPSTH